MVNRCRFSWAAIWPKVRFDLWMVIISPFPNSDKVSGCILCHGGGVGRGRAEMTISARVVLRTKTLVLVLYLISRLHYQEDRKAHVKT